jgi:CBS domain-containing protein
MNWRVVVKEQLVKDLMLPLSEYAVVNEDATLLEALKVLENALDHLPPGKPLHRAVLVTDNEGQIVGKLGLHGFIAALEPKYTNLGNLESLSKAGISETFVRSAMQTFQFWEDDINDVCRRAHNIKVGEVMKPVKAHIEEDASLTEAIHLLLMWHTQSLLVMRGDEIRGILRLSDLFWAIADLVTTAEPGDD